MIRNILFDADDTLLDFQRSEREALSRTLREFGAEPTPGLLRRYHEINASFWKLLELKQIEREDLKRKRYEQLIEEYHLPLSAQAVAERYEKLLGEQYFLIDGARSLLETLSPNYRLYIVSNGGLNVQLNRIRHAGIGAYFSDVFISQEVGYDKPDAEFFNVCFSRIPNFSREETVIVGDSLSSDIAGGKNAGIKTVWYHPNGPSSRTDIFPDCEIHHLSEFPAALERLNTLIR